MELGWGALILLCLAAGVAWFWQDSLAARESANAAAMDACQRLSLQFLDGTVAFARLSLTRELGRLRVRRTYVFDYTATSIERRQGFVLLTGARVESIGFASGDEQRGAQPAPLAAAPPHAEVPREPPRGEPAQVFDMEDFRARQRRIEEHQRERNGSEDRQP